MTIVPVILSGGAGTRLWPLSRAHYPKQFLPLVGTSTLLQETARRVSDNAFFAPPILVANEEHRFVVAEQLRLVGVEPTAIYLEPVGRNTAPAIAIAALAALARDPNAILLVLPSDHVVKDVPAFRADVAVAAAAARAGRLVTFGIKPTEPETGYGYIQIGGSLAGLEPCRLVARFVEKPDRARAEAYLAAGDHLWNSGMFAFSAQRLIEELDRHRPGIVA
ncbi:MAG: mannose-1-phosphate guanylyltransferase, partial [Alphaproteobacteria bacterium]|nr:mannose-1-phosphate guanylyltransferase [Alphaproteobacteria bacterium]